MNAPVHPASREGGTWTAARVARLTELWLDGVSAGLIAIDLGVSKNAVVGKTHRLKLPGRPSPIRLGGPAVPKKKNLEAATKPARAPVISPKHRNSTTGLPLGMTKLGRVVSGARFRDCQWISGEPSADDACKCGTAVGRSLIYCPEHEGLAWRQPVGEAA